MQLHSLLSIAALTLAAGGAQAQASTGSLVGWTTRGDVVSQAGAITVTTAFRDGAADQAGNLSGTSAVMYNVLANSAGVGFTALDINGEEATEGSLVKQSFSVLAGQQLSFSWSFSTLEDLFSDHAFAVVNGQVFTLATSLLPGSTSNLFQVTAASSGTLTLSLGVVDTGDFNGVSSLSISGLQVTAVPEPGSYALLLAGLVLVGAAARRKLGRG